MNRAPVLVLSLLVALATTGIAGAQSLAEIAKKEKERRKTTQGEAKTVITDRELATSYGGVTSTPAAQTAAEGADGQDAASESSEDSEDAVDETTTPEYWRGRVAAANQKIATLEEELSSDDWGEGQRFGVDPMGTNNLARREQKQQELDAARAELQAIRAEARRAGVPPGWVR